MPLIPVKLPDIAPTPPPREQALIADARARIEDLQAQRSADPIHAFVPSDFEMVYGALAAVHQSYLATGERFCEWGSGAGVVTCLAAMAGFDAVGIEIEQDLVELARSLARRHRVPATFCRGNFMPSGDQRLADDLGDFEWLGVGGPDAYELMDVQIDDFDVIFAYPWPGEQHVIERLFELRAATGALLMTYNGLEGMRLFRKQGRER